MVAGVKMHGIGKVFWILSDFRELSLCVPCGTCFNIYSPNILKFHWLMSMCDSFNKMAIADTLSMILDGGSDMGSTEL